jgi:hypothetical protein
MCYSNLIIWVAGLTGYLGLAHLDYRSYRFFVLIQVDQNLFFYVLFLFYFVLLYLTGCKLRYIIYLFLKKVIIILFLSLFFLNLIHLFLFIIFYLIKIKSIYTTSSNLQLKPYFFFIKKNTQLQQMNIIFYVKKIVQHRGKR